MEDYKRKVLEFEVSGMIKAYKEAIERNSKDLMNAPTLALENFFRGQINMYEGKLETAKEIQKLINK